MLKNIKNKQMVRKHMLSMQNSLCCGLMILNSCYFIYSLLSMVLPNRASAQSALSHSFLSAVSLLFLLCTHIYRKTFTQLSQRTALTLLQVLQALNLLLVLGYAQFHIYACLRTRQTADYFDLLILFCLAVTIVVYHPLCLLTACTANLTVSVLIYILVPHTSDGGAFPDYLMTFCFLSIVGFIRYFSSYSAFFSKYQNPETLIEKELIDQKQLSLQTLRTLAYAIDAKDTFSNGHSSRVAEYSALLAHELGFSDQDVSDLRCAALLHDIGKIGVPDSVLNRPIRLTDIDIHSIQSHTQIGGDILKNVKMIREAEHVARYHHEHYDGSGYPEGLKGESIPVWARIVSIADAYDAMNSKRAFRHSLPPDVIRSELVNQSGKQFDPNFLDVFLKLLDDGSLTRAQQELSEQEAFSAKSASIDTGNLMQTFMSEYQRLQKSERADYLTGLPLRMDGEAALSTAMAQAPGCLAFIDMDNLKYINDTLGHKFGDRILVTLADTLKKNLDTSLTCRMGGDEFLCFMKHVSKEEAEHIAQKLLQDFTEAKDSVFDSATLSIGLCMCKPGDDFSEICANADKALYFVKQNGKNSFSFFYQEDPFVQHSSSAELNQLLDNLRNTIDNHGAMDLEYREFSRFFDYLCKLDKRTHYNFRVVLITLENTEDQELTTIEYAMSCMAGAIKNSIRTTDLYTRHSSIQYMLILMGTNTENSPIALNRILDTFRNTCRIKEIQPTYILSDFSVTDSELRNLR